MCLFKCLKWQFFLLWQSTLEPHAVCIWQHGCTPLWFLKARCTSAPSPTSYAQRTWEASAPSTVELPDTACCGAEWCAYSTCHSLWRLCQVKLGRRSLSDSPFSANTIFKMSQYISVSMHIISSLFSTYVFFFLLCLITLLCFKMHIAWFCPAVFYYCLIYNLTYTVYFPWQLLFQFPNHSFLETNYSCAMYFYYHRK